LFFPNHLYHTAFCSMGERTLPPRSFRSSVICWDPWGVRLCVLFQCKFK